MAGGGAAERFDCNASAPGMDMLAGECRSRLRICICCSPSDPQTLVLLRRFPLLTSCCTVNFFRSWSAQALYSVAQQKLLLVSPALEQQAQLLHPVLPQPTATEEDQRQRTASLSCADPQDKLEQLCKACGDIFEATRNIAECYREEQRRFFYVTPASFLRFLEGFCYLYMQQTTQQQQQQQQYELGLHKLQDVSCQVMEMQQQLEKLQPELVKATEETQQLMQAITVKQEHAASTMVGPQ